MKLYTFFRSSASYRVRIALNLKGLTYESVPVHLRRGGGEQHAAAYKKKNPQELVPALEDSGRMLTQSLAIIEYLDERHPEPPLLPREPADRALVRAMALAIACEVHPIQNLRVLNYLKDELKQSEEAANAWARHWIALGLSAVEEMLAAAPRATFCFGDQPTLADICLMPQLGNARRFGSKLSVYPNILRVEAACLELAAFVNAAPENQPDAE